MILYNIKNFYKNLVKIYNNISSENIYTKYTLKNLVLDTLSHLVLKIALSLRPIYLITIEKFMTLLKYELFTCFSENRTESDTCLKSYFYEHMSDKCLYTEKLMHRNTDLT